MTTSVIITTSLDGVIAREDGVIDRLPDIDESVAREDCGCPSFFSSSDAIVMDRKTLELVCTFDERWNNT